MPTPKKSTRHKKLTGSYRPDRDTAEVLDVDRNGCIQMPDGLTELQQKIWTDAVASAPKDVLKAIDQSIMHVWVCAYSQMIEAAQDIAREGTKVKLPNGYLQANPSIATWTKCSTVMSKVAGQLGFDPQSRQRIKIVDTPKVAPEYDNFIQYATDEMVVEAYKKGELHPQNIEELRAQGRPI